MKKLLFYYLFSLLFVILNSCTQKPIVTDAINSALKNLSYSSDSYYINEEYYDSFASKGILIVSEPHQDAFTQIKLLEFLNSVNNKDSSKLFNIYCVEAAEGKFEVDKFREAFQIDSTQFYYSILDGEFSGWEYQLLKNKNIEAYGVEIQSIYQEQVNTFGNFYNNFEQRLYNSYILINNKFYKSFEIKNNKISNKAVKQIIIGALSDIAYNSEMYKDTFLLKYSNLIKPLTNNIIDNYINESLNEAFKYADLVNSYKNRATETKYYKLVKQYLPDSLKLISDMSRDIELYKVALKRDSVMAYNTINTLNDKKYQSCILFIGNFHKEGITEIFKRNHISYIFFEHSTSHYDYEKYLKIMSKSKSGTMNQSPLNPIINSKLKTEFSSYLERLTYSQKYEKIELFKKQLKDKISLDSKNIVVKRLNDGSSGERVYDVLLKDINQNVILKVYTDENKALNEKSNVEILNKNAVKLGYNELYPQYFLYQKQEKSHLIVQEKIESITFKQFISQDKITNETKDKYLKQYLSLTDQADKLYKDVLATNSNGLKLENKYKNSKQIYDVVLRKISDSKALTNLLYTEPKNKEIMNIYYKELELIFKDIFKGEFSIEPGIYIDYNMQNCFINNRLIDPTDNCIESAIKSKALKIKEIANFKLNYNKSIDDISNQNILSEIIKDVFKSEINQNNFKELIAQIFIFEFSDSKRILNDKTYIELLNAYNKVKATDKIKYDCMLANPMYFFQDRSNKNYLLINLLKIYNSKFKLNWNDQIRSFEKNFNNHLETNNIYFQKVNKQIA